MTFCRMILYVCLLPLFLILVACGDAIATNEPIPDPKTKPVTRAECLAMEIKEDKIACCLSSYNLSQI